MPEIVNGNFNAFHEAVTAFLKTKLAPVPVEEHFGPFAIEDLKRLGVGAPRVLLSITGPSQTKARSAGNREADLVVAAFVITKALPNMPAHKAAMALSEHLAGAIHKQTFGLDFVEWPREIEISNHFNGKLEAQAGGMVALFSVSWLQIVIFGQASIDPASLVGVAPAGTAVEFAVVDGAGNDIGG